MKIDIGCRYEEGIDEMKKMRLLDDTTKECSIALIVSSLKNHFKESFKSKIYQILGEESIKNDIKTLYFLRDISFITSLNNKNQGGNYYDPKNTFNYTFHHGIFNNNFDF